MKRYQKGITLSEYSFIIALVLIASIGALTLLGTNVNGIFEALGKGMSSNPPTPAVASPPSGSGGNASQAPSSGPAGTGPGALSVRLPNGSMMNLSTYSPDMDKSVQTIGANGTTEMLVSTIKAIVNQLASEGQITPEQATALMQMANAGHEMADLEKQIEDAYAASGGNMSKFLSTPVSADGANHSIDQTAWKLGLNTAHGPLGPSPNGKVAKLLDLKAKAEATGALKDPVVKQVIDVLVNQIVNIGNGVETAVFEVGSGTQSGTFYETVMRTRTWESLGGGSIPDSLAELPPSVITHNNSAGICTVGGEQDTGTQCQ